ncbi:helix-turn-helix domain-containing protein [Sporosarcina sp. SAFN-010]|uniref:helix-turn-helix domain-containing protein n=1 Tax=Sporosarcina sp. SAFN-010 TaxID=3387273 RepID=UPI003F82126F
MKQIHDLACLAVIEEMHLIEITEEWKQPNSKNHHLIYILEGRVNIKSTLFNGILKNGDMFVQPTGTESYSVTPITEPISAYYIRFSSASVSRLNDNWNIEDAPPPVSGKIRVQPIPFIRQRFNHLHRLWKNSLGFTNPLHIAWLELWEAIRAGEVVEEPNIKKELQNIIHHMDLHYNDDFQVEDMARHSGVTPTIFFKLFKESTSLSPLQYITRNRIEKARQLLVAGDASIREVANAVGYPDVYYFSRIFKKVVGIPPNRYRQLLQRKIAVLNPPLYDNLLALGVPRDMLIPFWNRDDQKEVYRDHDTSGMEFQWLSREKPELIFGIDNAKPMYDQLAKIAPTHLLTYKPFTWREHLRELATILQVEEIAEYWLSYYEQKVAAVRERIHRQLGDQTVLVALVHDEKIRVCGANRRKIGRFLYGDLQLNAPIGTDRFAFSDIENLTELNEFNADHILLLGDDPIEKETPVQISGQVHHARLCPWLHYSAVGHERSIEEALFYFSSE